MPPDEAQISTPDTSSNPFESVGSTLPDTWEAQPAQAATETPVTQAAGPTPAPAQAEPAAAETPTDAPPVDKFIAAAEAPTPEIYGELLGVRTELTSQLEQVKGRAALLSPILDQQFDADDDPKLIEAGAQLFDSLKDTDPRLTTAVLNGAIERYPGFLLDWAMESLGVTRDDYAALTKFKETGSWPGATVTPAGELFVPNTEGYATLADGTEIYVGDGAPDANKTLLALAKKDHERSQADAIAAKTKADQDKQRVQGEAIQRATTWSDSRGQVFDGSIAKLELKFGDEFKDYADDIKVMAFGYCRTDEKILGAIAEGHRLAAEGATKGATEKAAEVDRLTQEHVGRAATRISKLIHEVIDLRSKVNSGQPIIPGATPPAPLANAAAANVRQTTRRQDPYEDIWDPVGANLSDRPIS